MGLGLGHICGCSNNPMCVITEIQQFRRMGEARQKVEADEWKAMTINAKEVCKNRIGELELIRRELNPGIETW